MTVSSIDNQTDNNKSFINEINSKTTRTDVPPCVSINSIERKREKSRSRSGSPRRHRKYRDSRNHRERHYREDREVNQRYKHDKSSWRDSVDSRDYNRKDDRRRYRESRYSRNHNRSKSRSLSDDKNQKKNDEKSYLKHNQRSNKDLSKSRSLDRRPRTDKSKRESPDRRNQNQNVRNKYYKDVKTEENILMMYKRKYAPVYQGSLIRKRSVKAQTHMGWLSVGD